MVKSELLKLWAEKELKENRRISIEVVAKATGVDRRAISSLRSGETTRFDADVLARLCMYFGIEDGAAVPFLKFQLYPEKAEVA